MLTERVDRSKSQKLYFQLFEIIKMNIEMGIWRVGTQIPTEEQLCGQFEVSKATVRLAISELAVMGYLKKIQGKGTFVRRKKAASDMVMLANLNDDFLSEGRGATVFRLTDDVTLTPDVSVRRSLDLGDSDFCRFFSRVAASNGMPFMIQKLHMPLSLCPHPLSIAETADIPFPLFLEGSCGIKVHRMMEGVSAVELSARDAALLDAEADETALRILQVWYAPGDAPVARAEHLHRAGTEARRREFERIRV